MAETPWWQNVQGNTGTKRKRSPTGVAGLTVQNMSNQPTPYVPAWLKNQQKKQPTGIAGLAIGGMSNPALGGVFSPQLVTAQPLPSSYTQWWQQGQQQKLGGRNMDPNTGIPDFPVLPGLGEGSGSGFTPWKKRRRGGGGGRRPQYQPTQYPEREPYVPSAGQANWSIG